MVQEFESARAFLEATREAKRDAALCEEQIRLAEAQCQNVTSKTGDTRSGHSGGQQRDAAMIRLADLRSRIGKRWEDDLRLQIQALDLIFRVQGNVPTFILAHRYVMGEDWDAIRTAMNRGGMNYSERQVFRLHGDALDEVRKLWPAYREEIARNEDCHSKPQDQ